MRGPMASQDMFRKRSMDLFDFMTGKSLGAIRTTVTKCSTRAGCRSRKRRWQAGARSHRGARSAVADPDAFLRDVYRSQE
jgi:hypothetical protein